jgi:mono/diheme cytochrome c family protein
MNRKLLVVSIVFLLVVAGCFLYARRMVHRGFSTRAAPSAIESSLATSMRDMAIPARYKTMKNPVAATPEVIHEGMAHWADHCTTCHANNGSGDTMYGKTMYPRPPDMRQKNTQDMSDGELYYTIKNGVRLSGMPAFGDPGDDDTDSWKLVAFIRQLSQLTSAEETEMERLNPKSPDEIQEEKEEEEFLNGDAKSATPATTMHRH